VNNIWNTDTLSGEQELDILYSRPTSPISSDISVNCKSNLTEMNQISSTETETILNIIEKKGILTKLHNIMVSHVFTQSNWCNLN